MALETFNVCGPYEIGDVYKGEKAGKPGETCGLDPEQTNIDALIAARLIERPTARRTRTAGA